MDFVWEQLLRAIDYCGLSGEEKKRRAVLSLGRSYEKERVGDFCFLAVDIKRVGVFCFLAVDTVSAELFLVFVLFFLFLR